MIKHNAMYEHYYGGTVVVKKVEDGKVYFVNQTIPDMEHGECGAWEYRKFQREFGLVAE